MPANDRDVSEGARQYAEKYRARLEANRPTTAVTTKKGSNALQAYRARKNKSESSASVDTSKAITRQQEDNLNNVTDQHVAEDDAPCAHAEENRPTATWNHSPRSESSPQQPFDHHERKPRANPYANYHARFLERREPTATMTAQRERSARDALSPQSSDHAPPGDDPYATYNARFLGEGESTLAKESNMFVVRVVKSMLINKIVSIIVGLCLMVFSIWSMVAHVHLFDPVRFFISINNAIFGVVIVAVEAPKSCKLGAARSFILTQLGLLGSPIGRSLAYFYVGSLIFCTLPSDGLWIFIYIAMGSALMFCGLLQIVQFSLCRK